MPVYFFWLVDFLIGLSNFYESIDRNHLPPVYSTIWCIDQCHLVLFYHHISSWNVFLVLLWFPTHRFSVRFDFSFLLRRSYFLFNKDISISFNLNNFALGIRRSALCKFDVSFTFRFFFRNNVMEELMKNICKLVTSTNLHQIFDLVCIFQSFLLLFLVLH